mgnify:CR=1 FL=1
MILQMNLRESKKLLKDILELNGWTETHYNIVVKMLDYHAEEIKQFMLGGDEQ